MTDQPEGRALTMGEINAKLRANRCSEACSEQHTYTPPCQAAAPAVEACCVCGDGPVTYRNYREQPFCWPCADCQCNQTPCIRQATGRESAAVIADAFEVPLHLIDTSQPVEHCGHQLPPLIGDGPVTECVLRPGHQGSHANETGARWIETAKPGYCPHCGRGDCAPTADEYEASQRRTVTFQARIDAGRDWARRNLTGEQQAGLLEALRRSQPGPPCTCGPPPGDICIHQLRATLDPPKETPPAAAPVHQGGNAEDCPACPANPPYPFICPGPPVPGWDGEPVCTCTWQVKCATCSDQQKETPDA